MPIYPRDTKTKGTVYDVVYRHDGKTTWRRGFRTKSAARDAEDDLRRDRRQGKQPPKLRTTLGSYLKDEWLVTKEGSTRPKTIAQYRSLVNKARPLWDLSLAKLDAKAIQQWANSLRAEGLKQASVFSYVAILKVALNDAVALDMLPRNPAKAVKVAPRLSRIPPVLTVAEIDKLLRAADATRYGPMVRLAVLTGMRYGELTRMAWEDIDYERGTIRIPIAKTRRGIRAIAIGNDAIIELALQRRRQEEERAGYGPNATTNELVFTSPTGNTISPPVLHRAWRKIVVAAGLTDFHFHDTRHLHGNLLARAGVHPAIAQSRLGHEKSSLTLDIYTHVNAADQADAAAAVEGIIRNRQFATPVSSESGSE